MKSTNIVHSNPKIVPFKRSNRMKNELLLHNYKPTNANTNTKLSCANKKNKMNFDETIYGCYTDTFEELIQLSELELEFEKEQYIM